MIKMIEFCGIIDTKNKLVIKHEKQHRIQTY